MNNPSLIIYENTFLYEILYEIEEQLQFSIIQLVKKDLIKLSYLILYMKNQSLIINDINILYDILDEISNELNFSVSKYFKKDLITIKISKDLNYLFLTNKEIPNFRNKIVINKFPINIFKLVEKLNVEFLKLKFNEQSQIKIGHYFFDLNAREMINRNQKLKLTEKEINSIMHLFKIKKSVKVQELQLEVWGYRSQLETHTVETHIYRLRKKILKKFKDDNFIKSTPTGYKIN